MADEMGETLRELREQIDQTRDLMVSIAAAIAESTREFRRLTERVEKLERAWPKGDVGA